MGAFSIGLIVTRSSNQKDSATPIQVGIMSERQKKHSKLYKQYNMGRKLDAIPLEEFEKVLEPGVYIEPGTPVVSPEPVTVVFEDYIRDLVCDSDAVLRVTINDKESQLTESKEFIFTDHTAFVERIYKNNSAAPLEQNTTIIVTRPGGKVKIQGRVIGAKDAAFKYLSIRKQYLLFLRYVPETGAYLSIRNGSFLVEDDSLVAMTEESLPDGPGHRREFTNAVFNALHTNCNKNHLALTLTNSINCSNL
jgi:hypothetical protein